MVALTASIHNPPPDRFLIACGAAEIKCDSYHNSPNDGVVKAYHRLWVDYKNENFLIYMHDDVTIHDANWVERICLELIDPAVVIVGFGGATGIGVESIYKRPYHIEQMIRVGYCSNQTDAEVHGERYTGERRVAVVDGFVMAMKGSFLREVEGWQWIQSNFHCYDTAMCLEAYRRGYEARMVGVSCTHHGGGTSTRPEYDEWCKEHGTTMEEEHRAPHRWLYQEYRDIMPLRVSQ